MLQWGDGGAIVDFVPVCPDLKPEAGREGIGRIDLSPTLIEADEKKEGGSGCAQGIHVADPRHG